VLILDKEPQFAAELMKELNEILGIEIELSIAFSFTDRQTDGENKSRARIACKNIY